MKYQYSYSRVDLFKNCPQAFKLKHKDKKPETKGRALIIGGTAHDIIKEYDKHCIAVKKERDIEKAFKILNSKITQCSEDEFAELKDITDEYVGNHYFDFSFQTDFQIEQQLAYDENWNRVEWFADDVFWRGVMDRSHWEQDLLVITDYKSNRKIDSQSVIDNSLQLKIYAWLAYLQYPQAENILIRLDYIRYSVIRKRMIELDEILQVPDLIMQHVNLIEQEQDFKPKISSYCDWCSFQSYCNYFQDLLQDQSNGQLDGKEAAIDLATKVRAMESFVDQAKDRLKNWVEMNEPIEVGNEILDFHKRVERSFDEPFAVVQMLGTLGMTKEQIWDILNLSHSKVKSAMKKASLLNQWDGVAAMLTEKVKTTFGFEKVKE